MGTFQTSMLEAVKSLREEMQSMKKASEVDVDKTSATLSKAGPSKQPDPTTQASDPTTRMLNLWTQTSVILPPRFTQSVQSDHGCKPSDLQSDHSDPHSEHSEQPKSVCFRAKKHSNKKKTQGSGKVLFSVVFFRGRSVLCQKVYQTSTGSF